MAKVAILVVQKGKINCDFGRNFKVYSNNRIVF